MRRAWYGGAGRVRANLATLGDDGGFARLLPPIVAVRGRRRAGRLVTAALAWPDGSGTPGRAPLVRAEPRPPRSRASGVWVDIYDDAAWADPGGGGHRHGRRAGCTRCTCRPRTATGSSPFVYTAAMAAFVDAAHERGGASRGVVPAASPRPGGWTGRSSRDLAYTTPRATGSTGSRSTSSPTRCTTPEADRAAGAALVGAARRGAGTGLPAGRHRALTAPAAGRSRVLARLPVAELALTYDAILPMTYFTFRATDRRRRIDYVTREHR